MCRQSNQPKVIYKKSEQTNDRSDFLFMDDNRSSNLSPVKDSLSSSWPQPYATMRDCLPEMVSSFVNTIWKYYEFMNSDWSVNLLPPGHV